MTSKEIEVRDSHDVMPYSPDAQLEMASKVAKALITVVKGKSKPVIINNEIYLEFEDWQVVAQMFHVAVKTHAEPVEMHGVKGFKGYAELVDTRTGVIVGGSEAYCMQDEDRWSDRPMFQLNSMAQTRAGAKALRNRLSWVVMLAGYKTTPAEEMTGTEKAADPTKNSFYCKEHGAVWFKKGNMKNYAHPIQGTNEWCNMPAKPAAPVVTAEEKAEAERAVKELYDDPNSGSATMAKEAPKKKQPVSEVPPTDSPTNLADLMRWAYTHGDTYTPSWVVKTLGHKNPSEIKDIPAAVKTLREITGWGN